MDFGIDREFEDLLVELCLEDKLVSCLLVISNWFNMMLSDDYDGSYYML